VTDKIQAPRGTFDVLGDDALARDRLVETARGILEPAGYARIETPTFESTQLFARGVGESTDVVQKEMYTFEAGEDESLTLRPEGTAPVCRAYIEHGMHKLPQPVKLWYLSSFFRRERPQKGRFRQFWQLGVEAIGSEDPAVDAETILLLSDILDAIGARGLRLRLSSLGTADSREAHRAELVAYLRAYEDRLSQEVRERIDLNPLRAFDSDHPGTREVMAGAPVLLDFLSDDDHEHFEAVKALLDEAGVVYEVDPTLVRGLDYYTRTVFEMTSDALGAQSGVGGGGRYDGLVQQLGGPPTPGCGWAAGIERMLLAAPRQPVAPPPVDLFVALDGARARPTAFALTAEARRARLHAQLELAGRSLKGQLKQADRLDARYVAIVGDDGTVLKDMQSGEQQDVAPTDVVARILKTRGLR
jgi:histidyl-tRNA synthetase